MANLVPVFGDFIHPQVMWLLKDKALRCPKCGAPQIMLRALYEETIKPRFVIACDECKHQGPFGKSLPDAVKQWNKPESFWKTFIERIRRKR